MKKLFTLILTFGFLTFSNVAYSQEEQVAETELQDDTSSAVIVDSTTEIMNTVQFVEEEEIEESSEETFTENDCSCPICKCMNTIYTRWEKFVPSSPLEQIIKTNIDKIQL